jgi:hypothetical protein
VQMFLRRLNCTLNAHESRPGVPALLRRALFATPRCLNTRGCQCLLGRLAGKNGQYVVRAGMVRQHFTTADPFVEHDEAVGQFQQFLHFGRCHDHGEALVGEFLHHPVYFFLGAHIDTPGWVVEQNHRRMGRQTSRDQRLLLIAAGQRRDQRAGSCRFDAERFDVLANQFFLFAIGDEAKTRNMRQHARDDVVANRKAREDAF